MSKSQSRTPCPSIYLWMQKDIPIRPKNISYSIYLFVFSNKPEKLVA